jgi:hypothetical protein
VSRHENEVDAGGGEPSLVVAVDFAHQTLGPVAPHRVSDPAAGDEPDASRNVIDGEHKKNEKPPRMRDGLTKNPLELRALPESLRGPKTEVVFSSEHPLRGHYTASRALPFERRRFNTRRPLLVFIRARKPCFFFRLRL